MQMLKLITIFVGCLLISASCLTFRDHVKICTLKREAVAKTFLWKWEPYSLSGRLYWLQAKWNFDLMNKQDVRNLFGVCDEVFIINKKCPAYLDNGKLLNKMVTNLNSVGWNVNERKQ